jgi:hypothetical protein
MLCVPLLLLLLLPLVLLYLLLQVVPRDAVLWRLHTLLLCGLRVQLRRLCRGP